jgi:hypothetical protein
MSRDLRLEDYNDRTAVAPQAVLTVRTYATGADYEPDQCANPSTPTRKPAGHSPARPVKPKSWPESGPDPAAG